MNSTVKVPITTKIKNGLTFIKNQDLIGKYKQWYSHLSPKKKLLVIGGVGLFCVLFFVKCVAGIGVTNNPVAVIKTNYGDMKLELFEDQTPITVENFIGLANTGFYDEQIFHRVIKDFMIQGGCPNGNGTGGPGYTIKDEIVSGLSHNKRGILSMANKGKPNSGGSQFFITLFPQKHLDGKHTVFGQMIDGWKVLDTIGNLPTNQNDKPLKDAVIKTIVIKD